MYKAASVKGLWFRGLIEHSGTIATIEEWFDRRRLKEGYVPSGSRAPGKKTGAVPVYEFGDGLLGGRQTLAHRVLEDPSSRPVAHTQNVVSLGAAPSRGRSPGKIGPSSRRDEMRTGVTKATERTNGLCSSALSN